MQKRTGRYVISSIQVITICSIYFVHRFGQCWAALKDFLGEYRQSSKYQARSSYREEGKVCSHDRDCTRYDMNLYCQRDVKPGRKIWEAGAEERARLREEKRENTDYEKLLEELERNPRKRGREWMRSIAADYYEPNDWHQCRCRKGMKWNPLTAECQIYLVRQLIDFYACCQYTSGFRMSIVHESNETP